MMNLTPPQWLGRPGAVAALALVFTAISATPALAHAAEAAEKSSGTANLIMIGAGALIGIGIGMLIVFRARRKHPMSGGGSGRSGAKGGERGSGE